MNSTARHHALLLLAVFAAGGVLAPTLHRVEHSVEFRDARERHTAAGEHHHSATDNHGREALPPCSDPIGVDLTCVLCHVVSLKIAEMVGVAIGDRGSTSFFEVVSSVRSLAAHGRYPVRGPPKQAA